MRNTSAEITKMAEMGESALRKFLVFLLGHGAVTCSRSLGESPTEQGLGDLDPGTVGTTQTGERRGRDRM